MFIATDRSAEPAPESTPASPPAKKALPAALLARLKARGIAVAAGEEQQQEHAAQPSQAQALAPTDGTAEQSMPTVAENGSASAAAPIAGAKLRWHPDNDALMLQIKASAALTH